MDAGVLEFLAHRISSNVRVLEGALTRLFAFASLVGREINLDMTQECLADILRASERKVTVEEIMRQVADHYNLRMSDLLSPRRARSVARPRQVAMFLSKMLTSKSLPDIGRRFGGRDHTTVIHAVKKVEELKMTDSQIAEDVELLRRMLELKRLALPDPCARVGVRVIFAPRGYHESQYRTQHSYEGDEPRSVSG